MSQPINTNYHCSQAELYAACRLITGNYNAYQPDFEDFKAKYDSDFADDFLAAIDAAQALPDDDTRSAASEAMRTQLIPLNRKCLDNWQALKRYTEEVSPPEALKAALLEAGSAYYESAAKNNWEDTDAMNVNATAFMSAHGVELLNGGLNMPAGFPATCAADAAAFKTAFDSFVYNRQTGVATAEKVEANNALYDTAAAICRDGKTIFINDAPEADLFTWDTLINIISAPGSASLTVTVVADETSAPISGATVNLKLKGEGNPLVTLLTDENGEALFAPLDPGKYVYGCNFEDSHPEVGQKEITGGVDSRLEIRLIIAP